VFILTEKIPLRLHTTVLFESCLFVVGFVTRPCQIIGGGRQYLSHVANLATYFFLKFLNRRDRSIDTTYHFSTFVVIAIEMR
jgi:hypothetical protein